MKLSQLNTAKAMERFKEYLISGGILSPDGIKEASHIFVGGFPTSGLPDNFMFLETSTVRDEFPIARVYIYVGFLCKMVNSRPNHRKIELFTDKVSEILEKNILDKEYEFSISPLASFDTGVSIINGYGMVIINVFCQMKSH